MAKIELNLKGLNELMKSEPIQNIVKDHADTVAEIASSMSGEEYNSDMRVLNWVAVGTAFPASKNAARDNYRHNTLEKALNSTGLPRHK